MGTTGSSSGAQPPLRGQNRETSTFAGESSPLEYANESGRQRTRSCAPDPDEPRSQGPSPYATLRSECWNHRPSAPSLSNLPPCRETLLTTATQMTGWQTAEGHSPFSQQHLEAMELSRIISQLAMANQQLASAHTVALAHLETLYVELRKEREARNREVSTDAESLDDVLRKRLTADEEEHGETNRGIEFRIGRLESLLRENDTCQSRQRSLRREEDRKLSSRIERLESLTKRRFVDGEEWTRCTEHFDDCRAENFPTDSVASDVASGRIIDNNDVPELRSQPSRSRIDEVDEGPANATDRTRVDDEETGESRTNLHLGKWEEARLDDEGQLERAARDEVVRLSGEVERLKAEQVEYQSVNERLLNELAEQKATIGKLTTDYAESKARCEQMESSLRVQGGEYEKLVEKFNAAKEETERLLKEIDCCSLDKDTAEARISGLEEELEKSLQDKEEIRNSERQKTTKLSLQLSEEILEKQKQVKALEDALDEIQRLKETIKTERKSDDPSKEDTDSVESMEEAEESAATERVSNIEEFKKELTLKREARQRAIAAVSSEMERLRRELDAEKEAHSETSKVLELLRSAQNDSQPEPVAGGVAGGFRRSRTQEPKPDEQEVALKRVEAQRLTSVLKVSDELRNDVRLQIEKVDDLRYQLETGPEQHRYRIRCLTDLTNRSREALHSRERRANELKDHLAQILVRLGDRSFLDLKDDVGLECERQLDNINTLKALYNERLKMLGEMKESAGRELADVKERLDHTLKNSECLEEDLRKADEKIDTQDTEISNLESQLGLTKADCRDLQNQMSLINGLFTQMLLGASSADMDLDRLTQLLQENHDLISDMARKESTEAAALPKLLLDLVEQVEGGKGAQKRGDGDDAEGERREEDLQQEDIAHNLPKVWRVLLELLSCHAVGTPSASAISSSDPNSCYKSVDTPAGPRLVISVSKTYIRLKELILEKKHLEKEMNRMKQLNVHLECKLGEQEKRLSTVSDELTKTWTIVDRMQAQHKQLHTHEKILRYELQQKRKMLQELKQELEYCREKWESARQKNTNTELEWRSLRREFAARKALAAHDSFNNSAESGFSDERGDDTDEEDNAVEGRIRLGPRRKPRKESPRAPTPDTESEQPTDTELSESKTGSSATLEQRTPTPDTDAEADDIEVAEGNISGGSGKTAEPVLVSESSQESLDPLDQALTNVIQDLIGIENGSVHPSPSETLEDVVNAAEDILKDEEAGDESSLIVLKEQNSSDEWNLSPVPQTPDNSLSIIAPEDEPPAIPEDSETMSNTDGENAKTEESLKPSDSHVPAVTISTDSTMSIFSIGPFPPPGVIPPSAIKTVQFRDPLVVGPSNRFFAPVFGAPPADAEIADRTSCSPCDSTSSLIEGAKNIGDNRVSRSTESVNDSDVSADSSSSLETVKEFTAAEPGPSSSTSEKSPSEANVAAKVARIRTPEEALAAREDRLKRLEEQADWLMKKMNATSRRGSALSTRLEELHEVYGEPPVPPPMPDVLPSRRLRTNLTDLPRQVPESSSAETENQEKPVSGKCPDKSSSDNVP